MRLIDADALIEDIKMKLWDWDTVDGITSSTVLKQTITDIGNAPTIDAVPVVRCKDCVYRVIMRDPLRKPMDCYGCKVMHYNEDDWFCSFGERKDDDGQR